MSGPDAESAHAGGNMFIKSKVQELSSACACAGDYEGDVDQRMK